MNEIKTARDFYKEIEKEKDKYKLVNGLFIIKYIDKDISQLIAEFLKSNTARNEHKTNKVKLVYSNQLFNKKKNLTKTYYCWKPLNISFKEQDITNIL